MYCLSKMFLRKVILALMLASALADTKDASPSTTVKTPAAVNTRFFGLDGILGNLFQGHHHNPSHGGFGGHFQQTPYPVQQNPQDDWQNIRSPQQFPNQGQGSEQQSNVEGPTQAVNQGNFNTASGFGPGGTLDDIPSQGGMQNQNGGNQNGGQTGFQNQNQFPGNQMGFQNQFPSNQMGFQNQFPGNQMGVQNQFPGNQMSFQNQIPGNQMGFQNQFPGNQMGSQNQQGIGGNDPVAVGKPVAVPPTSGSDSIVFQDGSDTPIQRQCVQECESTSEYNPVCGSNNITYFNPGRFVCARNCGLGEDTRALRAPDDVFLQQRGRCF